ncbi:MAG: rhomboid family intramembrane serine protease [Treponemataceae bacterium]
MNFLRKPFRYSFGNATFIIIGLNILAFIAQNAIPNATAYLALNPINVIRGHAYWQFVTYMFAHGDTSHLFFNMFGLFVFGSSVERHTGTKEFLLYYLVTGILAGLLSFGIYVAFGSYRVYLLGASGALFAVMMAYAVFFPTSVIYIWGLLPVRAPVMVLGYTAIELGSTIFGYQQGVAHLTHLAGFLFAYLYFLVRYGANPWHSFFSRR